MGGNVKDNSPPKFLIFQNQIKQIIDFLFWIFLMVFWAAWRDAETEKGKVTNNDMRPLGGEGSDCEFD
jgi:hypothetical protein